MKGKIRAIALVLCAVLALPQVALAADADDGVTAVSMEKGYSITMLEADDTTATAYSSEEYGTVYKDVAKMELSFAGDSTQQYMVFLLQGEDKVPTDSNLRYIDQVTGDDTETAFTIYPDSIATADTYTIYVSSTVDEYAKAGEFTVLVSYTLGDVDMDNSVTSADAAEVLSAVAQSTTLTDTQKAAAMVYDGKELSSLDASCILEKVAQRITQFPVESN